jgi:hypothetical protein
MGAATKGGIEMDEQSRPAGPEDGQGTEDAGSSAAEQPAKQRSAYLDPRGSEGTRELRDTARRRRDAEEKLQQHLMEAKEHVPNEFHEHHATGHPHARDTEPAQPEGKKHAGEEAGDES